MMDSDVSAGEGRGRSEPARRGAARTRKNTKSETRTGVVLEHLDEGRGPVGAVRDEAHVGERLLRAPDLLLLDAQAVGEVDEEAPIPAPLVGREGEDAREVVPDVRVLLLREVPDRMEAVAVELALDVKEERLDVVEEGLVVEEELSEVAQVLAVDALVGAVHLEHGHVVLAVDLVPGRVAVDLVVRVVVSEVGLGLEEVEGELAKVQALGEPVWVVFLGGEPGRGEVGRRSDAATPPDAPLGKGRSTTSRCGGGRARPS